MSPGDAVYVGETLHGLGLPGAIIIVLMAVIAAMGTAVYAQWRHSNKVYGYRLAERDTLNKALTDASSVLHDLLKTTADRNDLTSEQAELLANQSHAFELLKVTILGQYDAIKQHDAVMAQTVGSMAEAIRTLTAMVNENRSHFNNQVQELRNCIAAAASENRSHISKGQSDLMDGIRRMIGLEATTIVRRRKSPS